MSTRASRLKFAGALALVTAGVLLAVFRGSREVERRLTRLRNAGYPLNPTELNAWYPEVPPNENLVPQVLDAAAGIRANSRYANFPWAPWVFDTLAAPGQPLTPLQIAAATSFRRENSNALSMMLTALQRPKSRFPVDLSAGFWAAAQPLPPLQSAVYALSIDAELKAEEGQGTEAIQRLVAGLKLADAVGDLPEGSSYTRSIMLRRVLLEPAEFVLSRQVVSEVDLEALQEQCMRATDTTPIERALAGNLAQFLGLLALPWEHAEPTFAFLGPVAGIPESASAPALHLYWRLNLKGRDRRVAVGYYEEALSAMRLPDGQQWPALQKAQKRLHAQVSHDFLPIARTFLAHSEDVIKIFIAYQTRLRAAATACAVERYRLAHGDALPETLGTLVPTFMPSVPLDPWTRQPLHYRKLSPGYVVYGVGEDGNDDNGTCRPPGNGATSGYDDTFTVVR